MAFKDNPRLVLGILFSIFAVVFVLSLLSPAFYSTGSTAQGTHVVVVTPLSYLEHLFSGQGHPSTTTKFNGLSYTQQPCVYHD